MFDLIPSNRGDKSLLNYFDNLEKNLFGDFMSNFSQFGTDIVDQGDQFVLQAELPGFDRKDISIDIINSFLTIRAEHREDREETKNSFVRRERRYGSFSRGFDVTGIKTSEIKAKYENGILELNLPKAEPTPEPKARKIDIS